MSARSRVRRNLGNADQIGRERADDVDQVVDRMAGPGVLLTGFSWSAGEEKTLRHPLRQLPRGWWASRPRGGVNLQEVSRTAETLTLSSATAGQADVWVF